MCVGERKGNYWKHVANYSPKHLTGKHVCVCVLPKGPAATMPAVQFRFLPTLPLVLEFIDISKETTGHNPTLRVGPSHQDWPVLGNMNSVSRLSSHITYT